MAGVLSIMMMCVHIAVLVYFVSLGGRLVRAVEDIAERYADSHPRIPGRN